MMYYDRAEVEAIGRAGAKVVKEGDALRARYLSSFWLYLEPKDKAFTPHVHDGFWEAWITMWISQQFSSHKTFIDVGANVGYYTMMAAQSGLQTIAVEPNPVVMGLLKDSARLNRLDNIEFCDFALADKPGQVNLVVPAEHSGGASLVATDDPRMTMLEFKAHKVKVETFDRVFNIPLPNEKVLVKIDAEGAEPEIWRGMQDRFWRHAECTVILEWESSRFSCEAFGNALFDKGRNTVSVVTYDGYEKPMYSWRDLAELPEIQMVVVRKDGPNRMDR